MLPNDQQIAWLADTMAARMLADAADHPRAAQLDDALRFWLPAEDVTALQLVAIRQKVQAHWKLLAGAVDARRATRVERGVAVPLDGCEGRV